MEELLANIKHDQEANQIKTKKEYTVKDLLFHIHRGRIGRVNIRMSHMECGNDQRSHGNAYRTIAIKKMRKCDLYWVWWCQKCESKGTRCLRRNIGRELFNRMRIGRKYNREGFGAAVAVLDKVRILYFSRVFVFSLRGRIRRIAVACNTLPDIRQSLGIVRVRVRVVAFAFVEFRVSRCLYFARAVSHFLYIRVFRDQTHWGCIIVECVHQWRKKQNPLVTKSEPSRWDKKRNPPVTKNKSSPIRVGQRVLGASC